MESNKKSNRKTGRPKLEEAKLTESINLKLTKEDFRLVKEKAEKFGLKVTQYARELVLNGGIKARFSLEELSLMRNLSGMANNFNQIARKVNRGEFLQIGLDLVGMANKIKELLK